MIYRLHFSVVSAALLLGACTTLPPSGPSMMALPGTGRSFDQFRADDSECRQYANAAIGGNTPSQVQADSAVKSAVVGTAIGAVAGAALGGSGSAAAGAGAGLLVGSMAGAGAADVSAYGLQRRYDAGYVQCMYAKGHRVPVSGRMMSAQPPVSGYRTAPGYNYPPPPQGYPPPPPGYGPAPAASAYPPPPPPQR
jgi:hypothetical protein